MLPYIFFVAGMVLLMVAGEILVKGSVGLATRLGISPLVIGLTIVAFGTSAPELVISLDAAYSGSGGIAIGNVVGSNIANVLLVLGAPALIASFSSAETGIKRTLTFLIVVTAAFMFMLWRGTIGHLEAWILIACLVVFLVQQFLSSRGAENGYAEELEDEVGAVPSDSLKIAGYILVGIVMLPLAAHLAVTAAINIATQWNISDAVIGVTIVALGTSLPELATTISAARNGSMSLGIGNVIGSNFFNIAAIIGITGAIWPIPVDPHIVQFDMWVMAATTIMLLALPLLKLEIGKKAGTLMLSLYAAYIVTTFAV